jgi:hypothetical protein
LDSYPELRKLLAEGLLKREVVQLPEEISPILIYERGECGQEAQKETDAGNVPPSPKKFIVTGIHDHKTLKLGDVVLVVKAPNMENLLFRFSDCTLHDTQDKHDQYVHLIANP